MTVTATFLTSSARPLFPREYGSSAPGSWTPARSTVRIPASASSMSELAGVHAPCAFTPEEPRARLNRTTGISGHARNENRRAEKSGPQ